MMLLRVLKNLSLKMSMINLRFENNRNDIPTIKYPPTKKIIDLIIGKYYTITKAKQVATRYSTKAIVLTLRDDLLNYVFSIFLPDKYNVLVYNTVKNDIEKLTEYKIAYNGRSLYNILLGPDEIDFIKNNQRSICDQIKEDIKVYSEYPLNIDEFVG